MLQRVQTVLTLLLLGAVIFMGVELYRGQRHEAATALMMEKNEAATALMMQKSEAATASMMERLAKLAEKPVVTTDDAAPVVVQTTPSSGDTNVDPSLTEIRVTYNKEMIDGSWAWVQTSKDTYPETTGQPRFEADGKTCVLPVKLYPGKSYVIWLNKEPYIGFHDRQGHAAVPYELRFTTNEQYPADAPKIVQTVPKTADTDVDPSLTEIRITYNKEMNTHSWSWCNCRIEESVSGTTGDPHYEADEAERACCL